MDVNHRSTAFSALWVTVLMKRATAAGQQTLTTKQRAERNSSGINMFKK
jgi:hypothetical protein